MIALKAYPIIDFVKRWRSEFVSRQPQRKAHYIANANESYYPDSANLSTLPARLDIYVPFYTASGIRFIFTAFMCIG